MYDVVVERGCRQQDQYTGVHVRPALCPGEVWFSLCCIHSRRRLLAHCTDAQRNAVCVSEVTKNCCKASWSAPRLITLYKCTCVRYAAAELDCCEAIARDPAYVKAFCRRATARVALKNYEGARDDYRRVLELEPNNKFARTELNALDQVSHDVLYFLQN